MPKNGSIREGWGSQGLRLRGEFILYNGYIMYYNYLIKN